MREKDGKLPDLGFADMAKRSERVPVTRRATVDVEAIMETWVDASPAGGMLRFVASGGVKVGVIVPRLLMYASPGPVTRKNPAASHHIVGSVRNRRLS